ncbi:MAG TPA: transposase, partial [Dehalococcoidia bacterium]|nr:transposase [Dehalococcoidia bacterium]
RERARLFADPAEAEALIECLYATSDKYEFLLLAYVVMPDHLHVILVPAPRNTISQVMRFIKGTYARAYNEKHRLTGPVRQASFYDRIVRDDTGFEEFVGYVHHNPVRAGIVSAPEEYRFSSAYPGRETDSEAYFRGQAECLPYGTRVTGSADGAVSE